MPSQQSAPRTAALAPAPIPTPQALVEQEYANTEESIRARAFQLYQERGMVDGYAEEDWLQAECEILSRQTGNGAA